MSSTAQRTAPNVVSIEPHALTAETIPAEGATIGYTGLAFYGEDFEDHGPISGAVHVAEHTPDGFYGLMPIPAIQGGGEASVFILLGDDAIHQQIHGFTLESKRGSGATNTLPPAQELEVPMQAQTNRPVGAYGGPAEEKIASPLEREALRMAGWRETRLKTLWSHPSRSGMFSVDEALDLIAGGRS